MGFNIQQYEMGDVYSNGSGDAKGYLCELIVRKEKRAECEKARDSRKGNVDSSIEDEPINTPKNPATNNTDKGGYKDETPAPEKSNTGLYIGIGVGVLAIGIVAIILIRRK